MLTQQDRIIRQLLPFAFVLYVFKDAENKQHRLSMADYRWQTIGIYLARLVAIVELGITR
ncbi:hypothetical protein [cf. Phormidesmis sp. LEGE 11477]|uniref:hypothetical protein n=1 Tax=cf. Phormidesmis sp. LEGE 11477 TaxID=1828680 RepID=UPI00187F0EE0|nr:hypothetical protein [cf. Phormidesmis sp. LEGE 11477]MBE9059871.1 hypothetical protein [cf. Phormidesmis sp. LEGE 11477]